MQANELIIIGGPNGSGKTTLAKEYLTFSDYKYLSADDIAFELNPESPDSVRLQAGKEFFLRFEQAVDNQQNMLIESTLSGKSLLNIIERIKKESNYVITLIFIFLDNESICVERVETRVEKGGHHVPKSDITRRFGRCIVNFWNIYRKVSNQWLLYYNTEDSFQEVAHHGKNDLYIYDEPLFDKFKELVKNYG